MLKTIVLIAMLLGLPVQAAPLAPAAPAARYAEGQVWEYRTRPGEEGSLLKIQRIEPWPAGGSEGRVYHLSVIGVRLGGQPNHIQHLPVTRETLDASVTVLSRSDAAFPSPDEGLAIWREAQGGVFTINMAEIVEVAERVVRQQLAREPAPPRT